MGLIGESLHAGRQSLSTAGGNARGGVGLSTPRSVTFSQSSCSQNRLVAITFFFSNSESPGVSSIYRLCSHSRELKLCEKCQCFRRVFNFFPCVPKGTRGSQVHFACVAADGLFSAAGDDALFSTSHSFQHPVLGERANCEGVAFE